jgi:hypothetical protein
MASLSCRISPPTSTVIFFDRSPLATAIVTSARLRTCAVRLLAIELTLSVRSSQTPMTSRTCACPPSLPSVPTSRATRVTSEVNTLSCLIMVLTMLAERRNSPLSGRPSTFSRTVWSKSPWATAAIARVTSAVGQQIIDQCVDRVLHLPPGAAREAEFDPLPDLSVPAAAKYPAVRVGRDATPGRPHPAIAAATLAAQPCRQNVPGSKGLDSEFHLRREPSRARVAAPRCRGRR